MRSITNQRYDVTGELVKVARSGEQAAWNLLHALYYPSLYKTALGLLGNTSATKDAVQDAFVTAYLKLDQLKDADTFGGWIKKILIHNCYRAVHSARKNKTIEPTESSACEDVLCRKYDLASTQNRLYSTLEFLPEVLRSTVLLRYFSDFQSYEEISAILMIPVGTVRSRLNQAKVKLAEYWKRQGEYPLRLLKEREEWNGFYRSTFNGMHQQDYYKNKFINHLEKNSRVIFTSGKTAVGSRIIENEVEEDRAYGSWFEPTNIMTSGNLSIVEVVNFNSAEYPGRCPQDAIFVLQRDNGKVNTIHFHLSQK